MAVNEVQVSEAGLYGNSWSSNARTYEYSWSAGALDLDFHSSSVNASGLHNRYYGIPVRCLVY